MIDFKNKIFVGSDNRKSVFDCEIPVGAKSLIIFVHGYKGYKDWGAWNLMQAFFIQNKIGVLKFNMSHNGGTVENPIDFDDLDAFGLNCYSYELYDLNLIIEEAYRLLSSELDLDIPMHLIGHSRGGGLAILEGVRNDKIAKIVSWAGISDIGARFPDSEEELEDWKRSGVKTVLNGRTNQEMPHYYSFYEDFIENQERLNIQGACENNKKPFLQIHGDMDQAVSISEGLMIARWTETEVKIIKGAEHTFGARHPWESPVLPEEFIELLESTKEFLED
ncbi:MAG: pimeloyl-ACP methyl ester carboxylesterase [Arenicella sp.]|jgi:pimeloyl-ACP methyl ester carboxylesterase